MRPDHVILLAKQRLIIASAELEAEIAVKGPGWFNILYERFKDRAAEALAGLAFADASDAEEIRALQNRIKVFDEFIDGVKAIINEGVALDMEMREAGDAEIREMLATPEAQSEMREAGLFYPDDATD